MDCWGCRVVGVIESSTVGGTRADFLLTALRTLTSESTITSEVLKSESFECFCEALTGKEGVNCFQLLRTRSVLDFSGGTQGLV